MITEKEPAIAPGKLYDVLNDGRWAFYFDHHMISGFTKCEAYFQLRHIPNKDGKVVVARGDVHLKTSLGSWWAKTMEWYYTALAEKKLDKKLAVDFALQTWDDLGIDNAKASYPKSYDDFEGRAGAVKMVSQYFDFSFPYDYNNWEIIGIESGFGRRREVCVGENNKVVVYYMGRPDLLIRESKRVIPVDHKTKDYILPRHSSSFKPHAQTAGYIVASQVLADKLGLDCPKIDRVIINIAARREPNDNPRAGKKKPRFIRIPVDYSREELVEWQQQTVLKATRLRQCIETNEWMWNDSACHTYNGCDYKAIHARAAGARPIMIKSFYNEVEPWVAAPLEED